ncbi:hypothetical protein LshimejAT787_1702450 [Lyophyllum shimeji]|uniref:Uncharacterized protein n=1 Tax=Lyophyllum shimeji TaxID=47721 RepID=A0A9P3UTH3_LYOSH|nr:hypothetical protein LshimejAT787_1702450 [Lyophyllum shimeji]
MMVDDTSDDEFAQFYDDITPGQLDALEALEQDEFSSSVPVASDSQLLCRSESFTTAAELNANTSSRASIPTPDAFVFETPQTEHRITTKRGPGRPIQKVRGTGTVLLRSSYLNQQSGQWVALVALAPDNWLKQIAG